MSGKPKDITGKKFGRLTAIRRTDRKDHRNTYYWVFRCDCGVEKELIGAIVKQGEVVSCGCFRVEQSRKRAIRSGKFMGRNATYDFDRDLNDETLEDLAEDFL